METLSFVLGIAFIVVMALAIVTTYAFVKVIKVKSQIEELRTELYVRFENSYRTIEEENQQTHRRIYDFEKDIYSQLDSRLDKLESKLTNKK